jgi:hypothetical protein
MRLTRFLALVLAAALICGGGAVLAADGGDGADTPFQAAADGKATLGNCYWKTLPDGGGLMKVKVPNFCKNRMCRIHLSWYGDPIGAYVPGYGPGLDYMQYGAGLWGAGPAVNIGGWGGPTPDGWGQHSDGFAHILSAGVAADGSTMTLYDDLPGYENVRGKMTVEVVANNLNTLRGVTFWACKMG